MHAFNFHEIPLIRVLAILMFNRNLLIIYDSERGNDIRSLGKQYINAGILFNVIKFMLSWTLSTNLSLSTPTIKTTRVYASQLSLFWF